MSWNLIIRRTPGGVETYAGQVKGRRVTGWFKDFWRLYARMEKSQ